jgi:putative membrane protein
MSVIGIIGSVVVALAALLHVYIFVLESVRWMQPSTWRIFNVRDREQAEILRPMAYNQGFYNLFLAIGAVAGLVLYFDGNLPNAARALILFSTASMAAAAIVLTTTGPGYLRPALVQGTLPLIGFVLFLFA